MWSLLVCCRCIVGMLFDFHRCNQAKGEEKVNQMAEENKASTGRLIQIKYVVCGEVKRVGLLWEQLSWTKWRHMRYKLLVSVTWPGRTLQQKSCGAKRSYIKTRMHRNAHFPSLYILNYLTIIFFLKIQYYITYSSSVWRDVGYYHFAVFLRGWEMNRKCIVFWFRSNSVLWICLQALCVWFCLMPYLVDIGFGESFSYPE